MADTVDKSVVRALDQLSEEVNTNATLPLTIDRSAVLKAYFLNVKDAARYLHEIRQRACYGNELSIKFCDSRTENRIVEEVSKRKAALETLNKTIHNAIDEHFEAILVLCEEFKRTYAGDINLAESLKDTYR